MNQQRVRCWHSGVRGWGSADAELVDNTVTWCMCWHWHWQKGRLGISERVVIIIMTKNNGRTTRSWGKSSKWSYCLVTWDMGAVHSDPFKLLPWWWETSCTWRLGTNWRWQDIHLACPWNSSKGNYKAVAHNILKILYWRGFAFSTRECSEN